MAERIFAERTACLLGVLWWIDWIQMNKNTNKNNGLNQILSQDLQADLSSNQTNHGKKRLPPVQNWQPKNTSPLDIFINDRGEWLHEGQKMTRQSLVDLFASVLWVEEDELGNRVHYLRTPSDQYQIRVADAPLFVNRVEQMNENGVAWIEFYTTTGDVLRLDDACQPYFGDFADEERLYVPVRFGLVARFLSAAFFHLVQMGELEQDDNKVVLKLTSGGKIYKLSAKA